MLLRKRHKYFLIFIILLFIAGCSSNDSVEIRKFPYPYRAALTISSDIDQTGSIEEFLAIQKFLNDSVDTPYGKGLGLEIGNSYWYYNQSTDQLQKIESSLVDSSIMQFITNPDSGISIFYGMSDSLNEYSQILLSLIDAGYLDCLHSYGHFFGGFNRSHAEQAIALHNGSLPVDVFIDHEGAINKHNIGLNSSFIGDNPDSDVYHTDITVNAGIKFLWDGHVTHCIGQDADWSITNILKNTIEYFQDLLDSKNDYHHNNSLVNILKLDDDQHVFEFVRFINPWGEYSGAQETYIGYQLSHDVIDDLIENEGYMIFYTHLGDKESTEFLSEKTVDALRYIADKNNSGELFITTTSRLLNYNIHLKYLNWHVEASDDSVHIIIENIDNPVEGKFIPTLDDVAGITFYIPHNCKVSLSIENIKIPFIKNTADQTGQESVSIPWPKLEFPDFNHINKSEL